MNKLLRKANEVFDQVAALLPDYEVVSSCNNDGTRYLVPEGLAKEVTYYGKPVGSLRVSDHWNWFSSERKCKDLSLVQCNIVDMPFARKREGNDSSATKPRYGVQIAYYGTDSQYHCVYGEKFNRRTHKWEWQEALPEDILEVVLHGAV